MSYYNDYKNSKNNYNIITEWTNITQLNNIWKCIDNSEIVVFNKNINILNIFANIFCDIMKNSYWNVKKISEIINTDNNDSILRDISNKFQITILIINHYGSYKLYDSGEIVIMIYRYNDVQYRPIGILRNRHIYRYIHKNSYDYEYMLERLSYTGVEIWY